MNASFQPQSLFTAEKINERPPQTREGVLIWKLAMSAELLIPIVSKNDETRVFRQSDDILCFYNKEVYILQWFRYWTLAVCHKQTFDIVFYILFSLENDMLACTYFAFFNEYPGLNERPSAHSDNHDNSFQN